MTCPVYFGEFWRQLDAFSMQSCWFTSWASKDVCHFILFKIRKGPIGALDPLALNCELRLSEPLRKTMNFSDGKYPSEMQVESAPTTSEADKHVDIGKASNRVWLVKVSCLFLSSEWWIAAELPDGALAVTTTKRSTRACEDWKNRRQRSPSCHPAHHWPSWHSQNFQHQIHFKSTWKHAHVYRKWARKGCGYRGHHSTWMYCRSEYGRRLSSYHARTPRRSRTT